MPGRSLGQSLEDGIHLLRHGCQRKLKLVLCARPVTEGSGEISPLRLPHSPHPPTPGDTAGVAGAGHLARGASPRGMWEGRTAVGLFTVAMKRVLGKGIN